MRRHWAGLMAAIFVAMPVRLLADDDSRVVVHPGNSYPAFSVMLPLRWRTDAIVKDQAMVGFRPVSDKQAAPDYSALIYVVALPLVNYGDGQIETELERPIEPDLNALQQNLPEKYRLKVGALGNDSIHFYKGENSVHIAHKSAQVLTYSAYMFDPARKAWGAVTLIVSGHSKPLYASYVADLKKIAYSFAFLK